MDGWMNGVSGHFYALSRLNWAGDNLGWRDEFGMKHCPRAVSIARPSTLQLTTLPSELAAAPGSGIRICYTVIFTDRINVEWEKSTIPYFHFWVHGVVGQCKFCLKYHGAQLLQITIRGLRDGSTHKSRSKYSVVWRGHQSDGRAHMHALKRCDLKLKP